MPDFEFFLFQGSPLVVEPPPVVDSPIVDIGEPAKYPLFVYDYRTQQLVGEIHQYELFTWTQRNPEAGSFKLIVPNKIISPELIRRYRVIQFRIGGEVKFTGVIDTRQHDAITERWTLTGYDLKGWFLTRRLAGPIDVEQYSSDAETIAKSLVSNNGGLNASPARRFQAELHSGRTWVVQNPSGLGLSIDFSAHRRNLLTQALVPVLRAGDVLHDVVMIPNVGYEYRASLPVQNDVPFAVSSMNVSELIYTEDTRLLKNAIYMVGGEVVEVTNPDSIATNFRREVAEDYRDAQTVIELEQRGAAVITQSEVEYISAHVRPLWDEETQTGAKYGREYDVGWDVIVSIPEANIEGISRRIVQVDGMLRPHKLDISISLGVSPRTLSAILDENLSHIKHSIVS